MKKKSYLSPTVKVAAFNTPQLIMSSLTGTSLGDDLPIANEEAPEEMEGHSRRRGRYDVWEDEEEEEEQW